MSTAVRWSRTPEGRSDLMRFWGGRGEDFTVGELIDYCKTLPTQSATNRAAWKLEIDLDSYLTALTVDSIRALGLSLGGKKLAKKDMLSDMFSSERSKEQDKKNALAERVRRNRNLRPHMKPREDLPEKDPE